MFRKISLTNFKSFHGRTDIPLSGINIFAGANSSGKSTIIQSILLIKQTIEHSPSDRAIALNGPILTLGTFQDVLNAECDDEFFGVAWEIDVERPHPNYRRNSRSFSDFYPFYFDERRSPINLVSLDVRFDLQPKSQTNASPLSGSEERRLLQPRLAETRMTMLRSGEKVAREYVDLLPNPEGNTEVSTHVTRRGPPPTFKVSSLDEYTRSRIHEGLLNPTVTGARTEHCFPYTFEICYDEGKHFAKMMTDAICSDDHSYRAERELSGELVPATVVRLVENHLSSIPDVRLSLGLDVNAEVMFSAFYDKVKSARIRARNISRALQRLGPQQKSGPHFSLEDIRTPIQAALGDHFGTRIVANNVVAPNVLETAHFTKWFFSNSVHYLGPLRDEPKPIYPLESLANLDEVGYRGEHTAAVLDLNRDLVVEYVPSSFAAEISISPQKTTATLHEAVVDWLSYLGVADDVRTDDKGKIGHTLGVRAGQMSRVHDLTNVGVGVSQVLPIVVMSLISSAPCLLIFEQPELHLHPRVQARLADFFLSLSLVGKQCLLETHSEYLIERFRRRIAEVEGNSLNNLINIYFTERRGGKTLCKKLEVSKYGAIANWPADFFDQSQIETESILRAALDKKKREREAKKP